MGWDNLKRRNDEATCTKRTRSNPPSNVSHWIRPSNSGGSRKNEFEGGVSKPPSYEMVDPTFEPTCPWVKGPLPEIADSSFPDSLSSWGLIGPPMPHEAGPSPSVWRRMWLAWVGLAVASFGWLINGWLIQWRASDGAQNGWYPGLTIIPIGLILIALGPWNGSRSRSTLLQPNPSAATHESGN
jgi:hypothetical protein